MVFGPNDYFYLSLPDAVLAVAVYVIGVKDYKNVNICTKGLSKQCRF